MDSATKKKERKKKPVVLYSVVTDGIYDYKAQYGENNVTVYNCNHVDGSIINSFDIPLWEVTGLIVDALAASIVRETYPEGEDHTKTIPVDETTNIKEECHDDTLL